MYETCKHYGISHLLHARDPCRPGTCGLLRGRTHYKALEFWMVSGSMNRIFRRILVFPRCVAAGLAPKFKTSPGRDQEHKWFKAAVHQLLLSALQNWSRICACHHSLGVESPRECIRVYASQSQPPTCCLALTETAAVNLIVTAAALIRRPLLQQSALLSGRGEP